MNQFPYDQIRESDLFHLLSARFDSLAKHEILNYGHKYKPQKPYDSEDFKEFRAKVVDAGWIAKELQKRAESSFPKKNVKEGQTPDFSAYEKYELSDLRKTVLGILNDLRSRQIVSWHVCHRREKHPGPQILSEISADLKAAFELSRTYENMVKKQSHEEGTQRPRLSDLTND